MISQDNSDVQIDKLVKKTDQRTTLVGCLKVNFKFKLVRFSKYPSISTIWRDFPELSEVVTFTKEWK